MTYVKSLDGIRGLAILLVVFFHFGYFEFGWVGVQVFFVLSGYLITSILLEDKSLPLGHYLKRFYWRRMLRIFPLYFVFLFLVAISYLATKTPAGFAQDWPYVLTYTVNFARMRAGDTASGFFVHLWSLAVEEQFYFVWPVVVYACSPRFFKRLLCVILFAAPLLRLGMGVGLHTLEYDAEHLGRIIYAFPLSHFDAFAAGAAIAAFSLRGMKRIVPVFVMAAGIVALLGALSMALLRGSDVHAIKSLGYPIYMVQNYQFVWGYTAINTLSAALIIGALQGHRLFRVLETPFLVRVGKISYGMYVIHVPCFLLLIKLLHRYSIPMGGLRGLAAFLFYFAAVMVLSEISFRFFEKRFLALKDRAFVFRRDAAPTHG